MKNYRRYIDRGLALVILMSILSVNISVYADDTPADFSATVTEVNAVQSINPSLPTSQPQQKGRVGTIISNMFDTNGRIGTLYLKIAELLSASDENKILKWNAGGYLEPSVMTELGGNIGIGNTNPTSALDVVGDINFTGGLFNNGLEFQGGKFEDGTNTADAVYTGGNVGIGLTSPSTILHIQGAGGQVRFENTGTQMTFTNNGYNYIGTNAPSGSLGFKTGASSTSMVINSLGNVGIGTTSPTYQLDIGGAGTIRTDNGIGGTYAFGASGDEMILSNDSADTMTFWTGNTERFRVDQNGNVGIGNITPGYDLDVTGDMNFSGDLYKDGVLVDFAGKFKDGSSTDDAVYIGGSVGIGTNSPLGLLHVNSTNDASATSTNHALTLGDVSSVNIAIDNNEIMARNNGAISTLYLQADGGEFRIHNNLSDSSKFVIGSTGSVGIGTPTPSAKLDVIGNIKGNNVATNCVGNCPFTTTPAPTDGSYKLYKGLRQYYDSSFDCTFGGEFTNGVNSFKFDLGNNVSKCMYMFYVGFTGNAEENFINTCPSYGLKDGGGMDITLAWKKDSATWQSMWNAAVANKSLGAFKLYGNTGDYSAHYYMGINLIYNSTQPFKVYKGYGTHNLNAWEAPAARGEQWPTAASYSGGSHIICEL